MIPFADTLAAHGLTLCREVPATLQVNVGRRCNLACRHCHVEAGPGRSEAMRPETMAAVVALARDHRFTTADITGGAPELVDGIDELVRGLAPLVDRLLFRTNLVALLAPERGELLALLRELRVGLVASFPSLNQGQADSQRGDGVFQASVAALQHLNQMGFGRPGTGLDLWLVANPAGAFLPAGQLAAERRYRQELARRWDISFTGLFTFANVPLGRFRRWLERTGNLKSYLERLASGFNPATVAGLMCRTLVSVDWDGRLYDCDFNLAAGLPMAGDLTVHDRRLPAASTPVATGDHCYSCTAGSGFT